MEVPRRIVIGLWSALSLAAGAVPALGAPSASHGPLHALESTPEPFELPVGPGRAASNGVGWLVVYADAGGAVIGRRIDADGTPLGDSFAIAPDAQMTTSLTVARLGDGFVVSWVERVYPVYTLKAQRLDALGQLVGPALELDQRAERLYATTSAGDTSTLVASCHDDAACDTWLLGDGQPMAGETLPLDFSPEGVAVGYSDGMWLLAIQSLSGVSLARLEGDGSLLDAEAVRMVTSNATPQYPSVAPSAEGFVVSWLDYQDARFTTVSFDGDVATLEAPALAGVGSGACPVLARTPAGFALIASQSSPSCTSCDQQVVLRRFTSALEPTPAGTFLVEGRANAGYTLPFLAVDGSALLAVWTGGGEVLFSKRLPLDEDDAPGESTVLSFGLKTQWNPQGAPGPGGWLAAWNEGEPGGVTDVKAVLLSPDGAPRAVPFIASEGSYNAERRLVDVSGGAEGWLIAWHEGAVLRTRFIGPDGELSADVPEYKYSMLSTIQARLARSRTGWLLAWDSEAYAGAPFIVAGTRLDAAGNRLETIALSEGSSSPHALDAMGTADGYRVWWKRYGDGSIRHRTITSAGAASNVVLESVVAEPSSRELFATGSGESSWFGWQHDLGPSQGSDLVFVATPNAVGPQLLSQTRGSRLVTINGLAAGIVYPKAQPPILALATPGGPLLEADLVQGDWGGFLSQPVGDHLLVTVSRTDVVYGHPSERVYAYLEQIEAGPDSNGGGAAGAGGAIDGNGEGGAAGDGAVAAGGDGGGEVADSNGGGAPDGAAGTAITSGGAGGHSTGASGNGDGTTSEDPGGGEGPAAEPDGTTPADDSGCACHSAPRPESHSFGWLMSAMLLGAVRRRRRSAT